VEAIGPRAGSPVTGLQGTGVSVGVAELRPEHQSPDDVLAAADRAMYEAKRTGGGRVGAR
jgi:PleD family two-component response regulator